MPKFTAKITDDSKITVGQNEGNQFSVEITPDPAGLTNVIVRLSIPCGPKKPEQGTFLVDDPDGPPPNVNYLLPANADKSVKMAQLLDAQPAPPENYLVWETTSKGITIAAGTTMRIDVTGLAGNIPPGTANVIVGIRQKGQVPDEQKLPVEAKLKESDKEGVKIHYFTASKDYVLHASEEEVILSWHTSSAVKSVTLFKNNVKIWPPYGGSDDLFVKDKPGITSVYRLEAMGDISATPDADRDKLLTDGKLIVRTLTVQVAQAGWNRQPLPQGYPTALMTALSFTSGESDRLYGVFVEPKVKPESDKIGLYSSATGFPPWRMEAGGKDFSEIKFVDNNQEYLLSDMSHSPAVAADSKLWLIGGSAVDPDKTSNEVWYYHKNDTTKVEEWVRTKPGEFPPRMGHCVVNFKNTPWVLGGSDGSRPLNDVWSYDKSNQKWSQQTTKTIWPARCMFAAAATPASPGIFGFEKEKMWIYGGADDPADIVAKTDLWSSTDGVNWKAETFLAMGPRPGQPNGATLFWDDGLHLAGSFKLGTKTDATNYDGATLSEMVYSLSVKRLLWEANPVSWGWEQFGGNTFLMQSIVFNRFWFFWSLFRNIKTAPKLNIFIPS